jgi:hypothetical protein
MYNVEVKSLLLTANSQITVTIEPAPAAPVVSTVSDHLVSSATEGNQWYNSQGPIAGATAQTYYPEHTETFYVVASSNAGCQSASSNEVVFGFTGNKPKADNSFDVYPNPFNNRIYIDYSIKTAGYTRILMYNSIGNEVAIVEEGEMAAGNHKAIFNGSELPAGVYYCKIFSGDSVLFAKVIKNK